MAKRGTTPPAVVGLSPTRRNPFDETREPHRAAIWAMLVARDNEAFAAADWSAVADDFQAEAFEGVSAHGSADPADWSLAYPTLDAYRVDWLRMAEEFRRTPLVNGDHLGLLYAMSTLDQFDFQADRALVWKRFRASAALVGGGELTIHQQSVYRLRWVQISDRWRIVGFVGYLPLTTESQGERASSASGRNEHDC